jgi:hypothetical protein
MERSDVITNRALTIFVWYIISAAELNRYGYELCAGHPGFDLR